MPSFEEFWLAYPPRGRTPKRTNKAGALKAWEKLDMLDRQAAFDGLLTARKDRGWLEPAYIPHASTWLNQRRWEAESESAAETPDGDAELPFSPKERKMLRSWRNRVGTGCPHRPPYCEFREDCDERQLRAWTKRGDL